MEKEQSRNFGQWVSCLLQEMGPADVNVKPALESDWIYLCQALKTSRVGDIGGVSTSPGEEELCYYTIVSWPFLCLHSLFSASSPPHFIYFLLSAAGFALAFNA